LIHRRSVVFTLLLLAAAGSAAPPSSRAAGRSADAARGLAAFQARLGPGDMAGFDVLLVTLDTVRRDHLGCYGHQRARTPRIDALAADGALFEHAVTPVPCTLPAHCSLLTGLDPPRHAVRTNGEFRLGGEFVTLGEILRARGYATAAFVATYVLEAQFGLAQGFDHYDDTLPGRETRQAVARRAEHVTDAALAWLAEHAERRPEQPYFAWIHYFDAHQPYEPPAGFAAEFADSPYDGEIAYIDEQLGRLLNDLEARGRKGRALIVLAADHGEGLGEHFESDHSRLIYDSTMRVPLIVSCPQLWGAPCRIDDVTVGLIDLMPTVLSLLGVEAPGALDGLDLTRAAIGRDRALYIETLAPLVHYGWSSLQGLRTVDAKYILAPTPELFDLGRDPGELCNLLEPAGGASPTKPGAESGSEAAGVFPGGSARESNGALAAGLEARLAALMSRWPPAEEALKGLEPLRRQVDQKLAALGYVRGGLESVRAMSGESKASPAQPAPAGRPDPKDILPIYEDLTRQSPLELHDRAWRTVLSPAASGTEYRRALLMAQAAARARPGDGRFLATLGAARFRLGQHESALAALAEARMLLAQDGAGVPPDLPAFAALAHHVLGHDQPARAALAELRAHAESGANPDDAVRALLAEVERALSE
jgi:arylsulfatase A-like enzyme